VKLDPAAVDDLALAFQPISFLRVMPSDKIATPLGMGYGHSRFSSPSRMFQLVYIARDLATAIAETIVRDRFEGASDRVLDESEIEEWAIAEVTALVPLTVLDLRTAGLLRLGVSTDAARGKAHREGQELSEAVYGAYAIDGVLYSSRLTAGDCLAVYDRAVVNLKSTAAVQLLRHSGLVAALNSLGIAIRKTR
jgi:hypothetical protein